MTGQVRQIRFARRINAAAGPSVPTGKNSSGSMSRHDPWCLQSGCAVVPGRYNDMVITISPSAGEWARMAQTIGDRDDSHTLRAAARPANVPACDDRA